MLFFLRAGLRGHSYIAWFILLFLSAIVSTQADQIIPNAITPTQPLCGEPKLMEICEKKRNHQKVSVSRNICL